MDRVCGCAVRAGRKRQRGRQEIVFFMQHEAKYCDGEAQKSKSSHKASRQQLEDIAQAPASRHEILLAGCIRVTSPPSRCKQGCELLRPACLYVRRHISKTGRPNFIKLPTHVARGCVSTLLRRRCDTLCTSSFVDDAMHIMARHMRCKKGVCSE